MEQMIQAEIAQIIGLQAIQIATLKAQLVEAAKPRRGKSASNK